MTAAAKRARAAYQRDWHKRNPGKKKEYQQAYWQRKGIEAFMANLESIGQSAGSETRRGEDQSEAAGAK